MTKGFHGNKNRHLLSAFGVKHRPRHTFNLSSRMPYGSSGKTRRSVIAVDVDGVIAKYDNWKGFNKFGEPVKSAVESINSLYDEGYIIKIYTARPLTPQLIEWLNKYKIKWHEIARKEMFDVLIDDRVIQFNGSWKRTINAIKKFIPYWKK